MAAPESLLAQLSSWHKDGLQRLTGVVHGHKTQLAQLLAAAEAEIVELLRPLESEKPRAKRRARGRQQVRGSAAAVARHG